MTTDVTEQGPSTAEVALSHEVELLQEALVDLQLAMEDQGWSKILDGGEQEFTREGLARAAGLARVMLVAHPLIKRGVQVRQAFIWGQGVAVSAEDPDVNDVIQAWWDDEGNKRSLTGGQAQEELERALASDGNVFLAHFTNPRTGFVQVRSIPFDEVKTVITNPDDRDDPWLYERVWTERRISTTTGRLEDVSRKAYYPALNFYPATRAKSIDDHEVLWDAPVLHISVNKLDGWSFGIGDTYAAITWARAYRDFLTDWATLVKALSQFAFQATTKSGKTAQLRAALSRAPAPRMPGVDGGNPSGAGATVAFGPDTRLEAIPKTGATIDSDSGKPLAAMIAAALGIPVTILLGDPGTTGARAVAETLDGPMLLEMKGRRSLWTESFTASMNYVIRQAIKAPGGRLRGTFARDPWSGREIYTLAGDAPTTVTVDWPDLDDLPMEEFVNAVTKADLTGKVPPEVIVRLLLKALRVENIDEILADYLDADGKFIHPMATAAQAAVDAFRRGQDPAQVV